MRTTEILLAIKRAPSSKLLDMRRGVYHRVKMLSREELGRCWLFCAAHQAVLRVISKRVIASPHFVALGLVAIGVIHVTLTTRQARHRMVVVRISISIIHDPSAR